MPAPDRSDITQILTAWRQGDPSALSDLTPLVYGELHALAANYLARERPGHILQPSALVNEAFLRLMQWQPGEWQNRAHFFGVSATLMRRILVHSAREAQTAKRGQGAVRVSLSEADQVAAAQPVDTDVLALDAALDALEKNYASSPASLSKIPPSSSTPPSVPSAGTSAWPKPGSSSSSAPPHKSR